MPGYLSDLNLLLAKEKDIPALDQMFPFSLVSTNTLLHITTPFGSGYRDALPYFIPTLRELAYLKLLSQHHLQLTPESTLTYSLEVIQDRLKLINDCIGNALKDISRDSGGMDNVHSGYSTLEIETVQYRLLLCAVSLKIAKNLSVEVKKACSTLDADSLESFDKFSNVCDSFLELKIEALTEEEITEFIALINQQNTHKVLGQLYSTIFSNKHTSKVDNLQTLLIRCINESIPANQIAKYFVEEDKIRGRELMTLDKVQETMRTLFIPFSFSNAYSAVLFNPKKRTFIRGRKTVYYGLIQAGKYYITISPIISPRGLNITLLNLKLSTIESKLIPGEYENVHVLFVDTFCMRLYALVVDVQNRVTLLQITYRSEKIESKIYEDKNLSSMDVNNLDETRMIQAGTWLCTSFIDNNEILNVKYSPIDMDWDSNKPFELVRELYSVPDVKFDEQEVYNKAMVNTDFQPVFEENLADGGAAQGDVDVVDDDEWEEVEDEPMAQDEVLNFQNQFLDLNRPPLIYLPTNEICAQIEVSPWSAITSTKLLAALPQNQTSRVSSSRHSGNASRLNQEIASSSSQDPKIVKYRSKEEYSSELSPRYGSTGETLPN